MSTATIYGTITETSTPEQMNTGQTYQRIRIKEITPPDRLGRLNTLVNYLDCFIYGKKEIAEAWSGYRDNLPAPPVTVTVKIIGRLKTDKNGKEFNNITLRLINITFHYNNP